MAYYRTFKCQESVSFADFKILFLAANSSWLRLAHPSVKPFQPGNYLVELDNLSLDGRFMTSLWL